ncbi:MAG: non-canonical purine NTP pyrophosphatase, partial [Lactobacillus iners]|nr:non-canonical purine NTP pyrophosphatase [Lactobacillus iners]
MISNKMNFVIASNNIKKAKELENILYHLGYQSIIYSELMPYIQFPNEQNNSLEQNACMKAEFISHYLNNELV